MKRPEGLRSFTREISRPEEDSQYTQTSFAEMREVRLREGPVVACIVLTVFTQGRVGDPKWNWTVPFREEPTFWQGETGKSTRVSLKNQRFDAGRGALP